MRFDRGIAAGRAVGILAILASLAAPSAGAEAPANQWVKVAEDKIGSRTGRVLLNLPDAGKMLLLGGEAKGAEAYMQALNLAGPTWAAFAVPKPPAKRGMHCYYQAALDPAGRKIYCLDAGTLYVLDLVKNKWAGPTRPAALAGLSWHAAALDPKSRRLVVVGSDKRPDNVGWTRTAILDLAGGKWTTLPLPAAEVVEAHRRLVAAWEASVALVGRIRMAWYRDPKGVGTEAELKALAARCAALKAMPGMAAFSAEAEKVAALLAARKTFEALRAGRALQRRIDRAAEAQYPVPPSRRNSPLAFDGGHDVFVLFGGDHEDYQTNDTWVLDLAKGGWRRGGGDRAPSPRAGHALVYLPKCGRVALYEGYTASSYPDYRAGPSGPVRPVQLWLYDVKADRWDLLGAWRGDGKSSPPAAGGFYGYAAQWFGPPALAADRADRLVLAVPAAGRRGSSTWTLQVSPAGAVADWRAKLGKPPGERLYRQGIFLASHCEVPGEPKPTGLEKLPANRWVRLPGPPRNVAHGCRQRDWGTAVWDSANEQILLWGGGHCVRSSSPVIHYSPVSGRLVEGYDADEPYGYNGGGGFGSSLLNRPWVSTHGYNLYAYDPARKMLVTATGFYYDPLRMDWLRAGPAERPFRASWGSTCLEATPHGVVAWAVSASSGATGLWRLDKEAGWVDLKCKGKLYEPYCDSEGMTYDSKRDRLLLGWGGGYGRAGDGRLTEFSFATGKLRKFMPAKAELARIGNTREMMYLDHADWVFFAEPFASGDRKKPRRHFRLYDCGQDTYFLLDCGPDAPQAATHSQGLCYDAGRKLLYSFTFRGEAWAIRLDPASAKRLERAP